MWYPTAQRVLGPASKRRTGANPVKGCVLHSLEGREAGIRPELYNPDRAANWHATVLKDGRILQHHPFNVRLAHAGDQWCNDNTVGIEHEGFAGEPLTAQQAKASVELVRWLSGAYGFPMRRDGALKALWEHREVSDTGTACPSGRIPWEMYSDIPPRAPSASYQPRRLASFWAQAYKNGADPIRYDGDYAIYEIRVRRGS